MNMWVGQRLQAAYGFMVALSILAAALALPARGRAQDETSTEASLSKRVTVTTVVTASALALAVGAGLAAGIGSARRCSDHSESLVAGLGCGFRGEAVALGTEFALLPVALTLGSYLPHHGLDGRGKWYAALAGAAAGIGAGVGVLSIPLAIDDSRGSAIGGTVAAALVATTISVLALELSDRRQRGLAQRRASTARRTTLIPMASALSQGGAWLGVVGTL